MSILDFTTDLFRDPENLRAFIEDGDEPGLDVPDASLVRVVDDPETPELEVAIVEPDEHRAFDEPAIDPEAGATMWGKTLDG